MKPIIFAFILLGVCIANINGEGCRYILGRCVEQCPEGTHGYHSACRSPTWSERTCDNPEKQDMGAVCDLSRCDCDEPTVRDKKTGQCVNIEDCSK